MAKRRAKRKPPVPAAIFYTNPETGRRKRWKSGPVPVGPDGKPLRLFNSKGRKVRRPATTSFRSAKLSVRRLPSSDPEASINRQTIVRFAKAKTYNLFWLRAGVIKPGERELIWIGTKVFLKPITTRIARAMLRNITKRAKKSDEAIIVIDLIRRPKFRKSKAKKKRKR